MKLSSSGYLIKEGFKNLRNNSMASLASVLVLISCFVITGAAFIIVMNVTSLIDSIGDENEMKVYLELDISDVDAVTVGAALSQLENVDECTFYSDEEAAEEYKEILGSLYESMTGEGNPFGDAYKIKLKDLSKYSETVEQIEAIEGVETVSDNSEIARRLTKLNYFVTLIGGWVTVILGIVTLFIISNTIRITMYSRRFEISIMKSVGATNAFVRIPFIIEAMSIGLIAGLVSAGIIIGVYGPAFDAMTDIITFIGTAIIPIQDIWLQILVVFSGVGILIGALGGYISIAKYLRKEGGEILGW